MDTPDREGEPLESWMYRERECHIYRTAIHESLLEVAVDKVGSPLENDRRMGDTAQEMLENGYCGYTKTELTGDVEELPVSVYGGLTYGITKDGWVGFDTLHGFSNQPDTVEEVKAELEDVVDQLRKIESKRR